MLCDVITEFYKSLHLNIKLPTGVEVMNPYRDKTTIKLVELFYQKFYSDNNSRTLILGINPGRFGGGLTGIPFTDPIKLEQHCGIRTELPKKAELSADFIYSMINAYGGPQKFYSRYFISAVCPLGFTKAGKNLNYYDDKNLQNAVEGFIMQTLNTQLNFGINKEKCFCLGEGKNFEFLRKLNQRHSFFKQVIPLPHPRFIMQYRRKRLNEFVELYIRQLVTQ
jgi:hypothetical protein